MGIIKKETKIGDLYISDKTYNMALDYNGELVSDQQRIVKLLDENRVPIKAQFEVTQKCNFDCYYCYEKSLRTRKDMTLEEIKRAIDILDDLGVAFIELTGGEPLVRKEILEILKYINSKNFIISIITNGYNLTEEIAEELAKGQVFHIRLSLLAANENKCDELTKVKGSFQKTVNAARILKKYNIKFVMTSVITNQNINEYDEYKELEKELGIKIGFGMNVAATLTGFDEVREYELKQSDVDDLEKYIIDNGKVDVTREFICSGGKSKLAVDNQGNIIPCVKCREVVGNILEDDFYEVWESDKLREVREQKLTRTDVCLKCNKRNVCEAYCPAEYRYYSNDEDRCNTANLVYSTLEKRRNMI